MKSEIIDKILSENSEPLHKIIETVKNNAVFQDVMSNIKEEFFINDSIHGISHNERVALLSCYIGIQEGLDIEELKLVLEAAKYHDIGRGYEGNHGKYSTIIIDRNKEYIFPDLNENKINIIKALCHGHSVDDSRYEEIAEMYGIENINQFKKLLNIVKDADALDRVRLSRFDKLDEKYLRTEIAHGMIELAENLYREYRNIQQEILSEDKATESKYTFNAELRQQLLFDGENYYLLRSLNSADIDSLNNGNGIIPKIDNIGEHTVQDVMAQIRMQHKKTNLISMSEDPNIVLTYDKSNLHRFVLIKLSKEEIENSKKVFSAGEYLLGVIDYEIERIAKNAPEKVREILENVDRAISINEIVRIINGADRQVPTNLVETEQQYLSNLEQLNQSKKIAKCKVLNYYGLMRGIAHDERGKLLDISEFTRIMRNGYSSLEWLYSGKISQDKIINVPQILIDSLALLKQAEFQSKDKEILREIEREVLRLAISGEEINQDNYRLEYSAHNDLKNDLTIDRAYEITNGQISYIDANMQQIAIRSLAEMTLNKRKIIELLKEKFPNIDIEKLLSDTYCINQEMVTKQNNRGSQIGRNISFLISDYGYDFNEETSRQILESVENLTDEQLNSIISQGINANEINDLLIKIRDNNERIHASKNKGLGSKYIAEAIVEGYNWKKDSNLLTKNEKKLIMHRLLRSVKTNNELYKLYEAINKIQIGNSKFTQNEIFAIMINLAIDGKIGDISYNDLLKKDLRKIQYILLDNKEKLQTSVLPISIDLLAGRGKEIDKLKKELIDLGIDKEFIESKDKKNIYFAKKIIENYYFKRDISNKEKSAIIIAILKNSLFDKENAEGNLLRPIQILQDLGLNEQDVSGYIMNCAINGTIEQISYVDLISFSKSKLKERIFKDVDNERFSVEVGEMDILKAVSDNLSDEEIESLRLKRKSLGLDEIYVPPINEKNVFIAQEIVERYCIQENTLLLTDKDKDIIMKSLLDRQALQKERGGCLLINLMQDIEKLGFNKNQIYGFMINLSINGYGIENISGVDYTRLLENTDNSRNLLVKLKNKMKCDINYSTLLKARSQNLSNEDIEKLMIEYKYFNKNEDSTINRVTINNIYIVKEIVTDFCERNQLDDNYKELLIESILIGKEVKENCIFANFLQRLESNGFSFVETEEILIKFAIEGKITDLRGYTFRNCLNIKFKAKELFEKRDEFDLTITEKTFVYARQKIEEKNKVQNTKEDCRNIEEELIEIGLDRDFLQKIHEENLITAKEIVENFIFHRELTNNEKAAIIKTILSYPGVGKKGTRYLKNLIKTFELLNFSKNDIYGIIINYSLPKTSICKGVSLSKILNKNQSTLKRLKETVNNGEEIKKEVDEKTIRTMCFEYNNEYDLIVRKEDEEKVYSVAKKESINLGIEKEFLDDIHPQNIFVCKKIIEGYSFKEPLSSNEKKALMMCMLSKKEFTVKKPCFYLYSIVKELATEGLEKKEVYGFIIKMMINNKIDKDISVHTVISSPKRLSEYVRNNKEKVNGEITSDIIEKALIKTKGLIDSKSIAKATIELTVKGSGGSQICDDVQADYMRLLNERTNNIQKEGCEYGDEN